VQLRFEIEGRDAPVPLPGGGADLIAFLSFATSRGFGAEHPLIKLADRLHDSHLVPFGPLSMFYEAEPEDREDEEKLAMAWQEPAPLLDALQQLATAVRGDAEAQQLLDVAGADALPFQVEAMLPPLHQAAKAGRRVRMSYTL
jgi:hypothetical protein